MSSNPIIIKRAVAVILGAGASFDVIPEDQREISVKDSDFAPPLTPKLFNMPRSLEPILVDYPKAYAGIGNIRSLLSRDGGNSIETILRQFRDSGEDIKMQQFLQIPLYLQSLFRKISDNYCHLPINYSTLVSETLTNKVDAIAYITLNYDLLMEQALRAVTGSEFQNIDSYMPTNEKWMFAKLHGSANWGRKMKKITNPGESTPALLDCISKIDIKTDLNEEIEIDPFNPIGGTNNVKYYPALTVPVDDKYQFNCPPNQVEKLESLLKICRDFLIIGASGKDNDLLELLDKNVSSTRKIVIVSKETAEEDKARFKESVRGFNKSITGWITYNDGFSNFIKAGGIDAFLED